MTPEEIRSLDTAWHGIDVVLALFTGFVLGAAIFFILGYVVRQMEEKAIRKRAALGAPSRDQSGSAAA